MVRACVNPILTDFFTTSLAYPLPAGPRRARPHAYMGQDLDECVDPSALAIAEYVSEPTLTVDPATREALFRCSLALRHMESPALGTPYPDVAARAREVAQHPRIEGRCTFVIDANGPGAGAMSLFTSPEFPAPLIAIKATGGHGGAGDGGWLQRAEAGVTRPIRVLTADEEAADRGGSLDRAADSGVDDDETGVIAVGICYLLDADSRRHGDGLGDGGLGGMEGA